MTLTRAHGPWLFLALAIVLVSTGVLLALLIAMPARLRRPLLSVIVFLSGLFFALEYFLPTHRVVLPTGRVNYENALTHWVPDLASPLMSILSGLLFGLGLFSLTRIHVNNVARRRPGWYNSLALLVSIVVMLVFGFWSLVNQDHKPWVDQTFNHIFDGLYQNMDAAMFSLIAFYILSAAYRAFRIRSFESTILMVSALIVLMGLSFGSLITGGIPATGFLVNLRLETWSGWLLTIVSAPALRAIDFGIGLGMLAMSLRIWLGIERGALFGD